MSTGRPPELVNAEKYLDYFIKAADRAKRENLYSSPAQLTHFFFISNSLMQAFAQLTDSQKKELIQTRLSGASSENVEKLFAALENLQDLRKTELEAANDYKEAESVQPFLLALQSVKQKQAQAQKIEKEKLAEKTSRSITPSTETEKRATDALISVLKTCVTNEDSRNRDKNIQNLALKLAAASTGQGGTRGLSSQLSQQAEIALKELIKSNPDQKFREVLKEAYTSSELLGTPPAFLSQPLPPTDKTPTKSSSFTPSSSALFKSPQGKEPVAWAFKQPKGAPPSRAPATETEKDAIKKEGPVIGSRPTKR
jgi:hypothetical protein